jgi:hypothetical protein
MPAYTERPAPPAAPRPLSPGEPTPVPTSCQRAPRVRHLPPSSRPQIPGALPVRPRCEPTEIPLAFHPPHRGFCACFDAGAAHANADELLPAGSTASRLPRLAGASTTCPGVFIGKSQSKWTRVFHPQCLDENRRDVGNSQSEWTESKMDTPGSRTTVRCHRPPKCRRASPAAPAAPARTPAGLAS